MRRFLEKIAHHYRTAGLWGFLRKAGESIRRRLWSDDHWLVYEQSLSGALPAVEATVVRRTLEFEELRNFGYFKASAYPRAICARFERRNVCHGFFLGGRLATLGWSSPGYLELDEAVMVPCPAGAGLFDFYTAGEFRSRGYYTNALMQLRSVLAKEGFRTASIAVDPDNIASVRGIERAEFRLQSRVTRSWRFGSRVVRTQLLRAR